MRVLILSAIFACAVAAPSSPVVAIAPIIPAALPTLSPGDLQAAAIDAKVQAEDQARAIADQARLAADVARDQVELALEGQKPIAYAAPAPVVAIVATNPGDLQAAAIDAKVKAEDEARAIADQARLAADVARDQAELALEGQKEKGEEVTSIAKEKSEELFWNVEDKKWQAIDAVKTVEAKIDGAVANNAEALAKSLIPVVAPLPYANLVYAPGLIPLVKDEKITKTAEKEEKEKLEGSKLEGLALTQGIGLVGAPWPPLTLVQPGLLGAPLPLQPVLTPIIKHW
ncbi:pupal cuticle protein PCP52-like [Leguminivora glycinivorella]|uniref:pupal cuticle protein PCP52-like n=1 Tax=Leguminivora glycinivorella TaxID=1035111 RepID=UPI00200C3920|nr:pupal cuticle protein PCP52-like [Leguminivora glycinivorella]